MSLVWFCTALNRHRIFFCMVLMFFWSRRVRNKFRGSSVDRRKVIAGLSYLHCSCCFLEAICLEIKRLTWTVSRERFHPCIITWHHPSPYLNVVCHHTNIFSHKFTFYQRAREVIDKRSTTASIHETYVFDIFINLWSHMISMNKHPSIATSEENMKRGRALWGLQRGEVMNLQSINTCSSIPGYALRELRSSSCTNLRNLSSVL